MKYQILILLCRFEILEIFHTEFFPVLVQRHAGQFFKLFSQMTLGRKTEIGSDFAV